MVLQGGCNMALVATQIALYIIVLFTSPVCMVALPCNPSTWKGRQEEHKFKASLSNFASL
jgi:hypothetical protein